MVQRKPVRLSRAAQVGLIALVVVIAAAIGIYFGQKAARGGGGYRIGVRFRNALGVGQGAQVYLNGVVVGSVNKIRILPDASVEFVLNVSRYTTNIPKDAIFSVQSTFTGGANVTISAPPQTAATEVLPKHVLPLQEQPVGTPPLTIETFMGQSKSLGNRLAGILSKARPYGKPMLASLQHARANAASTQQEMRAVAPALFGSVRSTMARAKTNIAHAQQVLRARDQSKLASTAAALQKSQSDMKQTAGVLTAIKRDPQSQENVRVAEAQLRNATANLAQLSGDLAIIAKNPQTKAELLDAGARFRALLKRI
ncbi:MAG TPA: MlaD family protein [Candidatus Baltobacteraceae bacterium]|nr:MlaD family protein [Candidatus Baltobacteraceae bacterium]